MRLRSLLCACVLALVLFPAPCSATGNAAAGGQSRFISLSDIHYHFGDVPIYFTLGNNDAYDDYLIAPDDAFLNDTRNMFFTCYLKGASSTRETFLNTFGHSGNYSLHPPAATANKIISLNSIFFSKRSRHNSEGWNQLDWLASELASAGAEGARVWLIMHIPPGVDVRGSLGGNVSLYWTDSSNHMA